MAGKGEAEGVRKQGKVRKTGGRGVLGGQAPAVDGFLQWTGPCSGLVPVAACEGGTDYSFPEIWQNVEHDNALGFFDIMEESSSVD